MNRLIGACALLMMIALHARAGAYESILPYFPNAKTVCLAKVKSIDGQKITFAVLESLRGTPGRWLKLIAVKNEVSGPFPLDSEWLLVSNGSSKTYPAGIGWYAEDWGGFDWLQVKTFRLNDKTYISANDQDREHGAIFDVDNGQKGMSVDQIKRLLQKYPYKNE